MARNSVDQQLCEDRPCGRASKRACASAVCPLKRGRRIRMVGLDGRGCSATPPSHVRRFLRLKRAGYAVRTSTLLSDVRAVGPNGVIAGNPNPRSTCWPASGTESHRGKLSFLTTLACRCPFSGTRVCSAKLIAIQELEDRPDPRNADHPYVHGGVAFRASHGILTCSCRRGHRRIRSGPEKVRRGARY